MAKEKLSYKQTNKKLSDGSVKHFFYHKTSGTRLPDDPTSQAFAEMLSRLDREAVGAAARDAERNINWLIRQYKSSPDWKIDCSKGTQNRENSNIEAIERYCGQMALAAVEERGSRAFFLEWHGELGDTHPRAADMKLTRLSKIFSFGVDRTLLSVNPIANFRRLYKTTREDILWLPEHIAAMTAELNPEMRLGFEIAYHTGQRRGDILALKPDQYDGAGISLVQSKTKKRVYIPCTKVLKARLDAIPDLKDRKRIVVTRSGEEMHFENFKSQFDRAFAKAFPVPDGAPAAVELDLNFHDLRGTAVTLLAEAGCSIPEICAITGHSLESATRILERYLSLTKELAKSAIKKLDAHQARLAKEAARGRLKLVVNG
jgi:integrase